MSDRLPSELDRKADDGTLARSDLGNLIELLNHVDEETRTAAADAIKTHSKDHPDDVAPLVDDLVPVVVDPDQSSGERSNLSKALSQVALEHPMTVVPVAETLFQFTTNPWRGFSFGDAVATMAAESAETRAMLRRYVETGSQAERNNSLLVLSKVAEAEPTAILGFETLFAEIAEDEAARPQHRGLAAGFARAEPASRSLDLETVETLLHSSEPVAVAGGLEALDHALSIDSVDGIAFRERLDRLSADEAGDVDLGADERALAGSVSAALDSDSEPDDCDATNGPTRVYHPDDSDHQSVPSFCPSCGADLVTWSDVSFCPDCGCDLSV